MLWTESSDTDVLTEFSYREAKVEHYLERAQELLKMSRYEPALNALRTLFRLDPQQHDALELQKEISAELRSLDTARPFSGTKQQLKIRRNELVMFVDQDERMLTELSTELRRYGFRVVGAANFDEATEVLTNFKPDLILSEVNFENGPVGFDLYVWIRNNAQLAAIPFFFLATCVTREMIIAGKRMGVDEFIMKPLDSEVVIASVIKCLAQKKKARR